MDRNLEQRWRTAQAPFDGVTLDTDDGLPLSALRQVLGQTTSLLRRLFPSVTLSVLEDWHDHDGFVKEASPIGWTEVETMFASDEDLYAHRNGETAVRTGIYPDNLAFYLRFWVPEEYDNDHDTPWGYFDVTCADATGDKLATEIRPLLPCDLRRSPAKAFFDRTYSG